MIIIKASDIESDTVSEAIDELLEKYPGWCEAVADEFGGGIADAAEAIADHIISTGEDWVFGEQVAAREQEREAFFASRGL